MRGQRCFDPGHFWQLLPRPTPLLIAPELVEVWVRNGTAGGSGAAILVRGTYAEANNATARFLHTDVGAPQDVWIRYDVSGGAAASSSAYGGISAIQRINVTVSVVNKTSTRLPEAQWFSFNPPQNTAAGGANVENKRGDRSDPIRSGCAEMVANPWPQRQPWLVHSADEAVLVRNMARDARRRIRDRSGPVSPLSSCMDLGASGFGFESAALPRERTPDRSNGTRRLHAAHSSLPEGAMEQQLPGLLLEAAEWSEYKASAAMARGGSRWASLFPGGEVTAVDAGRNLSIEEWRFPMEDAALAASSKCSIGGGEHRHNRQNHSGHHASHTTQQSGSRPDARPNRHACELVTRLTAPRQFLVEDHSTHSGWELNKLGEWMDPSDYVLDAARSLAGVGEGVRYVPQISAAQNATLTIGFLDAAIVRWGYPAPFPTPMRGGPTDYTRGA